MMLLKLLVTILAVCVYGLLIWLWEYRRRSNWRIRRLQDRIAQLEEAAKTPMTTVEKEVNPVAYADATVAFDNINNEIYALRRYPAVCECLLRSLATGSSMSELRWGNIPEDTRIKIVALRSKVEQFNSLFRSGLESCLRQMGTTWDSTVRFPLGLPFDPAWDENILGDDVEEGQTVTRVIALGYEFPDSPLLGRQKSKIL